MAYTEEGEHNLEAAPLALGTGVVDYAGGKAKCPGLFVEVLRDRQMSMGLYHSSVYNV